VRSHIPSCTAFLQCVIGKIVEGQHVHRTVRARESVLEGAVTAREGQHRIVEFLLRIANGHDPLLSAGGVA
jgi:hypothetical protein